MDVEIGFKELLVNGASVVTPYTIEDHVLAEGLVLLLLGSFRACQVQDHDFELPSDDRNVVAVDRNGEVQWIIESFPTGSKEGEYREFWKIRDHHLARHTNGNAEFDPEDGSIVQSWPRNQLRIGEEILEVSGEVLDVLEFEGGIFVKCRRGDRDLYAFEQNGVERWRSDLDVDRGRLYVENEALWEVLAQDRTADVHHKIDPRTGERLESREIDT